MAAAQAGDSDVQWPSLLERVQRSLGGQYHVTRVLGSGGFATVFEGTDEGLDRTVAIKVMAPHLAEQPGMAARFEKEARTLARLEHPNIIKVLKVDQKAGLHFFVMPLVRGGDVDALLAQGPLPIDQAVWLLLQASEALQAAHAQSIVHRDVKPANMLLTLDGNLVVTDFGIAKVNDDTSASLTSAGHHTLTHASPEQLEELPAGPASDQYSLGVTAYQLLTGRLPFTGGRMQLWQAHMHTPPVPVREFRQDCPAELESAVLRMLAKSSVQRWPSLAALIPLLRAHLVGDGDSARRGLAVRAATISGRPRVPVSLTIRPLDRPFDVGATHTFEADSLDASGVSLGAGSGQWRSLDPSVVAIDPSGHATALAPGRARVSVTAAGLEAIADVLVVEAPVADLAFSPRATMVAVGEEVRVSLVARDRAGRARSADGVRILNSDPAKVSVGIPSSKGASGLEVPLRALRLGDVTIRADFPTGGSASMTVRVVAAGVERLVVEPAELALQAGLTEQLRVRAVDFAGRPAASRVTWHSSDPACVSVDTAGVVRAAGPPGTTAVVTARLARADGSVVEAQARVYVHGRVGKYPDKDPTARPPGRAAAGPKPAGKALHGSKLWSPPTETGGSLDESATAAATSAPHASKAKSMAWYDDLGRFVGRRLLFTLLFGSVAVLRQCGSTRGAPDRQPLQAAAIPCQQSNSCEAEALPRLDPSLTRRFLRGDVAVGLPPGFAASATLSEVLRVEGKKSGWWSGRPSDWLLSAEFTKERGYAILVKQPRASSPRDPYARVAARNVFDDGIPAKTRKSLDQLCASVAPSVFAAIRHRMTQVTCGTWTRARGNSQMFANVRAESRAQDEQAMLLWISYYPEPDEAYVLITVTPEEHDAEWTDVLRRVRASFAVPNPPR